MTVFALLGAAALWLVYAWLLAAVIASYLSDRKGYGEKPGLAFGLLLHVIGVIAWLVWPAKPGSKWSTIGPFGKGRGRRGERAGRADEPSGTEPAP